MASEAKFKPGDRVEWDHNGTVAQSVLRRVNDEYAEVDPLPGYSFFFVRTEALRLSQPSAERDGPKVGETWARKNGDTVLIEKPLSDGCGCMGGRYVGGPHDGGFARCIVPGCALHNAGYELEFTVILRLSAPSADKWEPKPGDFVRGRTTAGSYHGTDVEVQGWYREPMADNPSDTVIDFKEDGTGEIACISTDSLVLIRPAIPSPKAAPLATLGSSTLPKPQNMPIRWPEHEGQAPKLDPDGYLNREALDERRRGERLDFGARRLAAVQAHKLDLDRKIPTVRGRLAVEVKAALRTWPEAEED